MRGLRWLRASVLALSLTVPLALPGAASADHGVGCTFNGFLMHGFTACPVGSVVAPFGFPVTAQGVVTPQGFILTPQGQWLTPQGQVLNQPGNEFFSHGQLVSCVAHRAPHDGDENHGQIVSRVARGGLEALRDDPDLAGLMAECLNEITGGVLPTTSIVPGGILPGLVPNPVDDDDDRRGRGRGDDDGVRGHGQGADDGNRGPGRGRGNRAGDDHPGRGRGR